MPIDDILREQADLQAIQQEQQQLSQLQGQGQPQSRQQGRPTAGQAGSLQSIQIGRNDLQVILQMVQVTILLLILTRL